MFRRLCVFLCMSMVNVCFASDAIYCAPGKVTEIQSQTGNVVVLVSGIGWKQLGIYNEEALASRLALALAAQASGTNLMLAFPLNSGVVCSEDNWNVSPYKVRKSS